jgi:signal transduction histidine kinase/ligand-binding sensor domain-containing protein
LSGQRAFSNVWRGLAAAVGLAACLATSAGAAPVQEARATQPLEPLNHYKHVSWSIENGAPSRVNAIGQSRDGYLWIGSVDGLFRFDGVAFEPLQLDAAKPGRLVVSEVLGARSGEVWVGLGRSRGVAVYRGGRLVDARMPHPSREVTGLAEDGEGGIWVARGGRKRDTLARYWRGHWQEIDASWNLPDQEIWQIRFTRDGTMWVVLTDTVMRRAPGAKRFEATGAKVARRASIAEDALGRIWLSDSTGTHLLKGDAPAASSLQRAYPQKDEVGGTRILFDHKGDLWGATWTDGLFQIAAPEIAPRPATAANPHVMAYKAVNGLTSDQTHAVFEDREGNIWFGTELGLDMLRPAAVIVDTAIPANSPRGYRMATTQDGVVHIADAHTLYDIAPGASPKAVLTTAWSPGSVCAGRGNSVWLTLRDTVMRVRGGSSDVYPKPSEASAYGCAEDKAGRLWMAALDKGLYWFEEGRWRGWPGLSPSIGLPANAATQADGQAAILFRNAPPLQGAPPFTPLFQERFKIGGVEGVLPGLDALFVSGAQGFARLRGDQIRTLDSDRYPWLASVNGLVQTSTGETWTVGDAGIVRMRTSDLDKALERPGAPLPHQTFDFRDGLNSFAQKTPGPQITVGGDGRLWILTRRNVVSIDPARLSPNTLPPPVAIRSASAAKQHFRDPTAIRLPAGTTDLRIGYTALSLSVPSRVRFKYRLEGVERDWVDAGGRREVIYTNLHPGTFHFHVKAANNDGVWNAQGAILTITIPPTLVETWWFRAACVLLAALALWGVYALRLRQVAGRIKDRLEERAAERERIARELHDTLLQSVQGLIMRFQSVADHIPDDQPAKTVINQALDRADQMLVEGRESVRDLRRHDDRRLDVILRELAQEQPFDPGVKVELVSEGVARAIQTASQEEIVRIAGEALFNAARHAKAGHVLVRVAYGVKRLQVSIRDDGVGLGANRMAWASREGHYGLIGMHERARRMRAQLAIESSSGKGTTITLSVAASIAYPNPPWFARFGKKPPAEG